MVTLTIDGREVSVAEGTNLVLAAKNLGIEIPVYCFHPGLSVVGQCRICFVEVEGMPRLVTACSTPAQEGMVVHTASERVREARAAVMEFLLENHPLDCPVCDQAGECFLQDYSVEHGHDSTHMVDIRRTFPGLERRMIGPHVVQNQNRCIHCTRCIRFTTEVSETSDLTMKSRGNHSYIDTWDGTPFDNPWSACAADVCPVGALTVKEFRFRARVWHLDDTPSICPGCSIGCNIDVGHMKEVVYRFVPRTNAEINGWWMCDYGRFLAESLNDRDVERPVVRSGEVEEPLPWSEAIATLAEIVASDAELRVVASANLTNEALYLARKVFVEHLGARLVVPISIGEPRRIKNGHGEWIERVDAHPNGTGARLLGLDTVDRAGVERFVADGGGPLLLLDNRAHPWLASDGAAGAATATRLAAIARTLTPLAERAELLLAHASWIEIEGTVTSSTGRVQLLRRGFAPRAQALAVWDILGRLAAELGVVERPPSSARAVLEEMTAELPAFRDITFERLLAEPGVAVLEEVPDVG